MIKIAIVGHTNTGKTTLLRTMTKGAFGDIANEAETTKEVTPVTFVALRTTLVDTPGFRDASGVLSTLGGDISRIDNLDEEYEHEKKALQAIIDADAVLHVVSLEHAPDRADMKESALIRLANPRTVGLVNKIQQGERALSKHGADQRAKQWENVLRESGVATIVSFDAHWDRYAKLIYVFQTLADLLPTERRAEFISNLDAFKSDISKKQSMVAEKAAGCMLALRAIKHSTSSERYGFDTGRTASELQLLVQAEVQGYLAEFGEAATEIYALTVAGADSQKLDLKQESFKRVQERVVSIAAGGGIGTALGGVLGTAIGFLFGGPVGAVIGAKTGAALGGTAGLAGGALTETNTTITMFLTSKDLRVSALTCIAVVWCVTHHGFGKGPEVDHATLLSVFEFASTKVKGISHPDWERCSEGRMVEWFEQTLHSLEA